MTRNLKALGLALLAVFAMGAIAAQGASAVTIHHIESETAQTDLTGTNIGNGEFNAGGKAAVICNNNLFHGTLSQKLVTEVEITPTYSGCTLGGNAVTVDESGCKYRFTSETHVTGHAPVDLICNHTGSITITGPACTIHFSDTHTGGGATVNQNLTGVTYSHSGTGTTTDLKVKATVTNIKYEGTGFGCAILGISGTFADGTYNEEVTLEGFKHNSAHGTGDHVGIKLVTTVLP